MSNSVSQSNVGEARAQSFAQLVKEDFFQVLSGAIVSKPETKEFPSKKGGSPFRFMTFEVTTGDATVMCKIIPAEGEGYPAIEFFKKYRFKVLDTKHDDYNGIALEVAVIEQFG